MTTCKIATTSEERSGTPWVSRSGGLYRLIGVRERRTVRREVKPRAPVLLEARVRWLAGVLVASRQKRMEAGGGVGGTPQTPPPPPPPNKKNPPKKNKPLDANRRIDY